MYFLVSCSNGGGQVSPVQTTAFHRILLSFSNCVQFTIILLIVWSSFSLQGHVELGINMNLWRYDLVKLWPVTIAVNSAEIDNLVLILSFMYGKNNVLTAPIVELVHCSCHTVFTCCVCVDLNHYRLTSTTGWCYLSINKCTALNCCVCAYLHHKWLTSTMGWCYLNL